MINKTASFRVKPDAIEKAKQIIRRFISHVRDNEPETLLYQSWQKADDPAEFIHFMSFTDKIAEEHHRDTAYVEEFVAALYPLCEREPVFDDYLFV